MSNYDCFAEPQTKTGLFTINGVSIKGFVTSEKITTTTSADGTVTIKADPPYSFHDLTGKQLEYSEIRTFEAEFQEGRGGFTPAEGKAKPTILFDDNGVEINYTELLDVQIFNFAGKSVYTATNVNNVVVDNSILPNGNYVLYLQNKKGEIEIVNFMMVNGSIFIGK